MSDVARARIVVRGIVQGVFFRGATQAEARRLGVVGWVRNRPDGRVEAEVQGPKAAVDALVAWTQHGPPAARVHEATVTWITVVQPAETDFDVRR